MSAVNRNLLGDLEVPFVDANGTNRRAPLNDWPVLSCGITAGGLIVPARFAADGSGIVTPMAITGVSIGVVGQRVQITDTAGHAVTDTPPLGKSAVITDIRYSTDTAQQIDFTDSISDAIILTEWPSGPGGGQITLSGKIKLTPDAVLLANGYVGGNIFITAVYYFE